MAVAGRYAAYSAALESPEKAPGFVNETTASVTFRQKRQLAQALAIAAAANVSRNRTWLGHYFEKYIGTAENYSAYDNVSFTFGVKTARRLAELGTGGGVAVTAGPFGTAELTSSFTDLNNVFITLGAVVFDVLGYVIQLVLSSAFSFIIEGLFWFLRGVLFLLKQVVQSGVLTIILNIGVDVILILLMEIGLPLLFAALDAMMCLFDLFNFNGWAVQLQCVEERCFVQGDWAMDLLAFTSFPILFHQVAVILEATLNSRTGRQFVGSFVGADKTDKQAYSSKGRVRDQNGRIVDNKEPEDQTSYSFTFTAETSKIFLQTSSQVCAACFNCKVCITISCLTLNF